MAKLPEDKEVTGDVAGDSPSRAILTRAITVHARRQGLLPSSMLESDRGTGPGVLSSMTMSSLLESFASTEMAILTFGARGFGCHPITPGEPGYPAYEQVLEMLRGSGLTARGVLDNEKLVAPMDERQEAVSRKAQKSWNAVLVPMLRARGLTRRMSPKTSHWATIGRDVNAFLRHWSHLMTTAGCETR